MIKPTQTEVVEFLYQSNLIEGVDDPQMLADAISAWEYLMSKRVLTINIIKQTHSMLMRNSDLDRYHQGEFRNCQVKVGNRICLDYPLVPTHLQMQFVLETMRANPAPDWKALHIKYEEIHPFVDGNGRTGRMFMNWTRLKRCDLPLLIIKAEERHQYYKWFQ